MSSDDSPIEDRSEASSPEPQTVAERAGILAKVLLVVGAFLLAVALGWFARSWVAGDGKIEVNRPLTVVSPTATQRGSIPNVLGLELDAARQAISDAGIDLRRVSFKNQPYVGQQGLVVGQTPGPGESIAKRAIVLGIGSAASVPALVGRDVEAARKTLGKLGASVTTTYRYKQGADEGEVLATIPTSGASLRSSVELVVAEPPSSVFLSQLSPVESSCETAAANVDGKQHDEALVCTVSRGSPATAEYLLNRRINNVSATVGITDRSPRTSFVTVRVLRDRRVVERFTLRLGETFKLNEDVTGALRLRIEFRGTGGSANSGDPQVALVDAKLVGGRRFIEELTAESGTP